MDSFININNCYRTNVFCTYFLSIYILELLYAGAGLSGLGYGCAYTPPIQVRIWIGVLYTLPIAG